MPSPRKSLSKAEKTLLFVCLFAVLPLAAVVYVAGGRDADPKWNIAPLAPLPNPNGYDYYVAAAGAKVSFNPPVDPSTDGKAQPPNSPYALKNYSVARRAQWLKANTAMFALVNKGLATPSVAPGYSSRPFGELAKLRELARAMLTRTRTLQMQKQPMRATMSALDTLQMGQDTARGSGLIGRLVGIAVEAIGRTPLEDLNKTINSLSASEARTAARRLEALLAKEPTAAQTLTVDKRDSLIELRRIFATEGWRKTTVLNEPIGIKQNVSQFWQSQTTSKQKIYDNMNRALDAQIANAKLPYSKAQKGTLPTDLDIFTPFLTGTGNSIATLEARHSTSNNMLLLRLALRAYIAQHGSAPPTLSTLVPGHLKSIPADVYNDGKPLFYTPQGKTYRLWSVGPDGVNNGGVPLTPRSAGKAKYPVANSLDNKGDFVAGLCR